MRATIAPVAIDGLQVGIRLRDPPGIVARARSRPEFARIDEAPRFVAQACFRSCEVDLRDTHHQHDTQRDQGEREHAAVQEGEAQSNGHRSLRFFAQRVAHAAHGLNQARLAAGFGLGAQVAHVDFQHVAIAVKVVAPHILQMRSRGMTWRGWRIR